jgi:CIC family chloride channel protein
MKAPPDSLSGETTVSEAVDRVRADKFQSALVTDGQRLLGVVTLSSLQQRLTNDGNKKLMDFVDSTYFPHVHADQGLDVALERMGANHVQVLPVVSRADIHELIGVVTLGDVLDSYGLGVPDTR